MANPFGGVALIVMAIAGQAVAEWAKGDAVFIVAAFETDERCVITGGMTQADGA